SAAARSVAALDKKTGRVVWANGNFAAGYSSPVAFPLARDRAVAVFSAGGLTGRAASNGRILWHYNWRTTYEVNAATPIVFEDKIFISSGYNSGCALLQMTADTISARRGVMGRPSGSRRPCSVTVGYLSESDPTGMMVLPPRRTEGECEMRGRRARAGNPSRLISPGETAKCLSAKIGRNTCLPLAKPGISRSILSSTAELVSVEPANSPLSHGK
ncbi:MAG: hypothetical protein EBU23_18260, partial [Mycobacteriaceae bacterium]|nr:hypothetical protein [Mycobacteriaceae bacterium]